MGLSRRAYAKHRGVTETAVRKAIAAGRITLEPDGTIDPRKADHYWGDRTDPAQQRPRERPGIAPAAATDEAAATDPGKQRQRADKPSRLKPVAEAALGSVRETLKEQGLPAGGNVTFVQARTAHEIAKAHLARLKLQERKGELVDRARASALVFRLAREERDAWLNWPARVAALIAADLGVEAHSVQKLIETHVRAHLAELAEIRAEFR
jgi:hypothetical protein